METLCYFYHPDPSIWLSVDPLSDKYPNLTPYAYCANNPVILVDPDGRDWYETTDGQIIWDDKATSQKAMEDVKINGKYLGKNVLVGTHNRDENLNEPINTARFDLYLESDKTGPSATIYGNTIPCDVETYGTLAEGIYPASYAEYNGEAALLINNGGNCPTVKGNFNPIQKKNKESKGNWKPIEEHVMDYIYFHLGNYGRASLTTSMGNPISTGCQTGYNGAGSKVKWREFGKNLMGFEGVYYLRSTPKPSVYKKDGCNYK
jgi:hypothetical protein